jgi:hypothetical protein
MTVENQKIQNMHDHWINYPGDKSTQTDELETTKILLNSIISTAEAKFCTMDITNFYLNTPLD